MRNQFYSSYLPDSEIDVFVYGSNFSGRHGLGAAKHALNFGAKYGIGVGLVGNSYGIPTKDGDLKVLSLGVIDRYVGDFLYHTLQNPERTYYLTAIGCGLAGYRHSDIAPLFRGCVSCLFPIEWKPYLV